MRKTFSTIKTIILKACTIASKINVTSKGVYLPISKQHLFLAVVNLLAHNNKFCYCGQISLQGAAVNCSFFDSLAPLGVIFILLAMVHSIILNIFCVIVWTLTWPLSSNWLLVSLSLSKEMSCFIQWAPLAGDSGWTWILGGELGSAFPATTHEELRWLQC